MSYFARIASRIAAAPAAPGIAPVVTGAARPALSVRAPLSNGAPHMPFEPAETLQSSVLGEFDGDGLQGLASSAASSVPSLELGTPSRGDALRGAPSGPWPELDGPTLAPAAAEPSVVDMAVTPVTPRATQVASPTTAARNVSSARTAPNLVAASSALSPTAGELGAPPAASRQEQRVVSTSSRATEGQSALLQALGSVDAWLRASPSPAGEASSSTPRNPEPFVEPAARRAEPRRAEFGEIEALPSSTPQPSPAYSPTPAENTPRSVASALNAAAPGPVETAAVSDRPLISIGRIEVEVVPPPKPAPSAPRTGPRRAPRSAFAAEASRPFGWRQR